MNDGDSFELACDTFFEMIGTFKETLVKTVKVLDNEDWRFYKGTTKVCQIDETGRKKRCRVGIEHQLQVGLTSTDAEAIWQMFYDYFKKTLLERIERVSGNEVLGWYVFEATSQVGDQVTYRIYLPNEWYHPQIYLLGFVSARYRKGDCLT